MSVTPKPQPPRAAGPMSGLLGLAYAAAGAMLAQAIALFAWGLALPVSHRVRGDAWQYMQIASEHTRLVDLLLAVGPRSAGMPALCFAVRRGLVTLGIDPSAQAWANGVAALLFAAHLAGAVAAAALARRFGAVRTRAGTLFTFALVVGFPALVAHTTVPLTDTLNADLVLFALLASDRARTEARTHVRIGFGSLAGGIWAFALLLRPGNLLPAAAALVATLAFAALRDRRAIAGALAAIVACAAVTGPVVLRCRAVHGTLCVQAPETFEAIAHARFGMRGARVLWFHAATGEEGPPIVPDPFLVERFAAPCRVTSFVGSDDSTLTGCFARRLEHMPRFAVTKWIGLFDHFRYHAYAEPMTPPWYRAMSRAFDAVAWPGFFLGVIAVTRSRARLSSAAVCGAVFTALLVALHTIVHVEDRYGLAWVPLACVAAVHGCERACERARLGDARHLAALVTLAFALDLLFFTTVWRWDATVF